MSIATDARAVVVVAVLAAAGALAGCDDTTGVELRIRGHVAADIVVVTATSMPGARMHTFPMPGGDDWTVHFIATFRPDIGSVSLSASALAKGVVVADCPLRVVDVLPHRVVSAELDCGAPGQTGAGDMSGNDLGAATGGYFGAVADDLPIAYYHLGDPAGALAVSVTGASLDGTYGSAVMHQQASLLADAAATADGAAGFPGGAATAANSVRAGGVALAPKSALCVELWLRSDGPNQSALLVEYDYGGTKVVPVYSLSLVANHLVFYVHANGKTAESTLTSLGSVATGQIHHVVASYDESALPAMSLWIDGLPDSTLDGNSGDIIHGDPATSGLGIGGSYNDLAPAVGWDGLLDEVAIYDHALTADRVAAHYSLGNMK